MQAIPIDQEIVAFKKFIDVNPRCVFSAKFGDGKSYFLKQFCNQYKEALYTITLHPVNYSIAKNEDVFEYIKHDILKQLFEDGLLNSIDYNAIFDMALDLQEWKKIISYLLTLIPVVGGKLSKGVEVVDKIKDKYDERKVTYDKYAAYFERQKGCIYERDAYTQLICETIKHIHDTEFNPCAKKCVLVIEDMDRLDPAHLFRILNIITAHIDEDGASNKFGFDNIILVMDYDVTESIFHHFYGDDANFHGYMQKFVINKPYRFSISEVAKHYLSKNFEKDCEIPYDTLSLICNKSNGMSMSTLAQNLSVRSIAMIIDNKEKMIKDQLISLASNKSRAIKSKCALTYFLYYCEAIDKTNSFPYHSITDGILLMKDSNMILCKEFLYATTEFDGNNLRIETSKAHSIGIIPKKEVFNEISGATICSDFNMINYLSSSSDLPILKDRIPIAIDTAKWFIIKAGS